MEDSNQEPQEELNTEDLKRQLVEVKEESQTNLNGWKRSQADFENFKKRKEEEGKELVEFAREVTVVKMLPTLDTLTQMMRFAPHPDSESLPDKYAQWLKGVEGTVKQIDGLLGELGIKRIEAKGKKFDPHFHEAVREVEGEEDGIVAEEIQSGFELNGKVVRPSQVVITKKKT